MPLYEVVVVVERSQCIYVEADNEKLACEDANELSVGASDNDWEVDDYWTEVKKIDSVPKGRRFWSGGPDGDWVVA